MNPPQHPQDPGRRPGGQEPPGAGAKIALRDQMLTVRNRRGAASLAADARLLAAVVLAAPEVRRAATVAAYVSVGREPGTGPLLDGLRAAGHRVIVPALLPDNDLAWVVYEGPDSLAAAGRGLLEPTGPRLPVEAIATADAVLVPGLAVDRRGMRLGRGGGSYDRALARVPVGTFTCVLLHDGEVLDAPVPAEPHDRAVTAAASPAGLLRF